MSCATTHKLLPQQQQKDAEDTLEAISEQLDAIVIATASPEETAFVVGMAAAYRLGHAVTSTTATTNDDSDTATGTSTLSSGNSQVSVNCNIQHFIHDPCILHHTLCYELVSCYRYLSPVCICGSYVKLQCVSAALERLVRE
jgi:hypothetical protein